MPDILLSCKYCCINFVVTTVIFVLVRTQCNWKSFLSSDGSHTLNCVCPFVFVFIMILMYHKVSQKASLNITLSCGKIKETRKMKNSEVFNRLHNLIGYEPLQKEITEKTGILQNTLSAKKSRDSRWSEGEIQKLNKAYGVDIYKNIKTEDLTAPDCIDIPVYGNVTASMGYGIRIYDEKQTGTYSVSKKLAKDIGLSLEHSTMIFAKGDSMEPTITGGDSLLVDTNKKEVYDGSIYCVRIDGQLYAKRLQKVPPQKIKVISDNKEKYDAFYVDLTQEIDFDFEIIGEVRWWGRVAR